MRSRILLADDSITIQKVVNLTFADEGIDVVAVSNGEMAEKRLNEVNPDLVLADIFMPGKNGYELCEVIKKNPQFRNVPVLLLVGAFEPFDQLEAKRVKADGHLTKPFESRTLVETVRKLIQSASSQPRTGSLQAVAPPPQEPVAAADPLDTNPIAPPPLTTETAAPEFPIEVAPPPLSETSPLELDYSMSMPLPADEPEAVVPELETESEPTFQSGFVRTTGALSSVGPGAVHNGSDNGKAEVRVEPHGDASFNALVIPTVAPPIAGGMSSQFDGQADDLLLDLDASAQPATPASNSPASPLEAGHSVVNEGATAQPFVVETTSSEPCVAEPVAVDAQSFTKPAIDPAIETEFAAIDAPLEEFVDSAAEPESGAALQLDEPLGDVLNAEPLPSQSELAQPVAPADLASAPVFDLETPTAELPPVVEVSGGQPTPETFTPAEESRVETTVESFTEAPSLDVLMPPPIVPSDFQTNVVSHDQRGATAQPPLSDVPKPPAPLDNVEEAQGERESFVSTEESFAQSGTWTELQTASSHIDIEATAVDDVEEASAPAIHQAEPEFQPTIATGPAEPVAPVVVPQESEPVEVVVAHASVSDSAPTATPNSEAALDSEINADSVFPDQVMTDLPSTPGEASSSAISQSAMIDEIVRRVVAELSESVVREIAWEVVPDCVERVVGQMTRDGVAKRI